MMKSLGFEKDRSKTNKIKDVRSLFRLKKEIDNTTSKDARNLYRLKKEKMALRLKIQEILLDWKKYR